jgi:hypothetical protein
MKMSVWVWSIGRMILTGGNRSTSRKTCHSATFFITNPTWTDLTSNPSLRGDSWRLCMYVCVYTYTQTHMYKFDSYCPWLLISFSDAIWVFRESHTKRKCAVAKCSLSLWISFPVRLKLTCILYKHSVTASHRTQCAFIGKLGLLVSWDLYKTHKNGLRWRDVKSDGTYTNH